VIEVLYKRRRTPAEPVDMTVMTAEDIAAGIRSGEVPFLEGVAELDRRKLFNRPTASPTAR
jgi:hypothetical protein